MRVHVTVKQGSDDSRIYYNEPHEVGVADWPSVDGGNVKIQYVSCMPYGLEGDVRLMVYVGQPVTVEYKPGIAGGWVNIKGVQ